MFMALRRNIITATGITSLKLFIYGYTNSYIIYVFQLNINNISLVVFSSNTLTIIYLSVYITFPYYFFQDHGFTLLLYSWELSLKMSCVWLDLLNVICKDLCSQEGLTSAPWVSQRFSNVCWSWEQHLGVLANAHNHLVISPALLFCFH